MSVTFTHLVVRHRDQGVFIEEVLCPSCFEDTPKEGRTPHGYDHNGYELTVRTWAGEPRECSTCEMTPSDYENDQVRRAERAAERDFEAYHGGSSPYGITEQCAAALRAKNEGR